MGYDGGRTVLFKFGSMLPVYDAQLNFLLILRENSKNSRMRTEEKGSVDIQPQLKQ